MITDGYLAMHYQGRKGGRDPALLDIAQDYALKIINDSGLFSLGLTFKGGTALRKYRVGSAGRFSTDLDFSANEEGLGELLLETVHGAELHGVRFSIDVTVPGRRGDLLIDTPLGRPRIPSKIEITPRAPWLEPEWIKAVPLPVHRGYEFSPVEVPVMILEEAIAEKLAAYRRRALVRDLYDLALFHSGTLDEALIRKLNFLKVFIDVVEDGLGVGPFVPSNDILQSKGTSDFLPEDIGILIGNVDIPLWVRRVHTRFDFLQNTSEEEARWAQCNPRDLYDVHNVISALR
jgi:predicted nucleotidyltransferase component of viral defense system